MQTRYAVTIQGCEAVKVGALKDCYEVLNRAYSLLEDQYAGVIKWEIIDEQLGRHVGKEMAGGIWDACCEDADTFAMYLKIGGWKKRKD